MKQRLEEYYSKFKSIYNEKNYPDWFSFVESHNHENGVFFIKHCIHPGNRRGGRSLTKQDISLALDKFSW